MFRALAVCTFAAGFIAVRPAPRPIRLASHLDDDLVAFWREMNTFDDDVDLDIRVVQQPDTPRLTLDSGSEPDAFSVQCAPRIAHCSPGGDDYFSSPPAGAAETRSSRSQTRFSDEPPWAPPPSRPRLARPPTRAEPSVYDILGVPPDAPLSTARAAFISLAKRHHPDAGGDRQTYENVARAWATIARASTSSRRDSFSPR